jgi:hypothetical protein
MHSIQPIDPTKPCSLNIPEKGSVQWLNRSSLKTGWRQTMWKDFRIAGPMFLITIFGLVWIQLLIVLYRSSMGTIDAAYPFSTYTSSPAALLFMSAPFIVVLGCAALLIGADRESNTWSWCSSLPIDWRLSLSSKLAVAVTFSLIAALLTAILPATLNLLPDYLVTHGFFEAMAAAINTILVWAQLLLLSYLCQLLFNESLKALFVAIGALIAFQSLSIGLFTGYLVSLWQTVMGSTGSLSHQESVASVVLNCLMLAIQAPLLLWLYRWRWYSGQQTDWMLSLLRWGDNENLERKLHSEAVRGQLQEKSETEAAELRRQDQNVAEEICDQAYRNRWMNGLHPSLLWTEMWLAVHNQFRVSAVFAVVAILVSKVLSSQLVEPRHGLPNIGWISVIAIATAVSGVLTFTEDQTRSRYRFLADRGAGVWYLLLARLTVSAATVALTILLVSQFFLVPAAQILRQLAPEAYRLFLASSAFGIPIGSFYDLVVQFSSTQLSSIFGLAILVYLWQIGVLASICFRRPMSALFATVSTIVVINAISLFVFYLLAAANGLTRPILSDLFIGPWLLLGHSLTDKSSLAVCIFLSFVVIMLALQSIAMWRFTKRLLVSESPGLGFRFLAVVPGSFLVAFLLISFTTATFGFLVLPAYDEKKIGLLSVDELIQLAEFEQPDLGEVEALRDSLVPGEELVARLNLEATADEQQDLSDVLFRFWNRLGYEPTTRQPGPDLSMLKPSLDEAEMWKRATEEISALESSLTKPFRTTTRPEQLFLAPVNRAVMRAALIGKLAGLAGEPDLSRRAWTAAHRLWTAANYLTSQKQLHSAKLHSANTLLSQSELWELASTLSESEIRLLGGPEVVRSILPPKMDSWKQQLRTTMQYHTSIQFHWLETPHKIPDELVTRFYLRQRFPFLVRHYPPLRWLSQRSMVQSQRSFVQWLSIEADGENIFYFDREIKAQRSLLEKLDQMEAEPSSVLREGPAL